jgi:Zn-finger nucleic acid-binding protein
VSPLERALRCPDDRSLLRPMKQDAIRFDVCRKCAGLWFSRESIESVDPTPAVIPEASRRTRKISRITSQPRQCPVCAKALTQLRIDGLDIDRCAVCHGVWLDPGEYEAARQRLRKAVTPLQRSRGRAGDDTAQVVLEGLFEVVSWLGGLV